MERVSVIVPVYNQAPTVGRTIESILAQDYDAIELIVVNDGSTDSTGIVLEQFRDKITILDHQEPKGPYKSRFKGISKATGRWISFVDADDEITPISIRECVSTAKQTKADIVQMKIERRSKRWKIKVPVKQEYDETRAFDAVCYNETLFPIQCWGKIYSSRLIRESEKSFIQYDGFWGEDRLFNLLIFAQRPNIKVCRNATYKYNWGGATTKYTNRLPEFSEIQSLKIRYLTDNKLLTPDLEKYINAEFIRHIRYNTRQMINSGHKKEEIIKGLKTLKKDAGRYGGGVSPLDIYFEEKQSVSRRLKHLIHQLL